QVLGSQKSVPEATHPTSLDFLKIVPATRDLAGAEIELVGLIGRENILKEALLEVDNLYDFILIDCPPSLGLLTINALTAAHSYLIPLQCEYYAMEGLSKLIHTVKLIRQRLNPNLKQEGILLTMFDKRNNLCHQVAHEVRSHFKKDVFESVIPRNVRLSECPSHGKPIILYDIGSAGAESYLQLAQEIIGRY
ncbi:MAG: AAA family ATPase, partial [Deltaproteobacteria bacterium]|nr:AAA family ATPase [Deltaproteobacteria bacterium]